MASTRLAADAPVEAAPKTSRRTLVRRHVLLCRPFGPAHNRLRRWAVNGCTEAPVRPKSQQGAAAPASGALLRVAGHPVAPRRLGSVRRMPIRLENVGIAVRDLEATIAFFTDLGLTVLGRDTVSGEWTDTAVGLDGNHAKIAMLQTPDGNGRLELFEYIHPDAIETEPTRPNEIGMHRVAFSVDDIDEALEIAARHGCHPLRGVATYEDVYRLTYVRGPSGILVMLAQELRTGD
jgi:glyoxylase I family protein